MDTTLDKLLSLEQVRQLLESHRRISGMACGLMDNDENIIVAAGLQEACTRFHWSTPEAFARCWRRDPETRTRLHSFAGDMLECRCKNGMVNVAMPVVIEGSRVALFFAGQFFYDDDPPDPATFRLQAEELGFDMERYLAAIHRVPLFSRADVADTTRFLHQVVQLLAETGHANLRQARWLEERRQIDRELSILAGAVNSSADAFFLTDGEYRFRYVNVAACRSLGYSREELLTKGPLDIDPDVSADMLREMQQSVSAAGYLKPFETRHRTRDGRIFPVEISVTPFEHDGVTFALCTARDISERKKAEQRIGLLSHALDQVREGAFLMDDSGRFLYVNQEACRSLGYTREELLAMAVPDIDPDFSPERVAESFADLVRQGSHTLETRHRTGDGRVFPVEITSTLLEYGDTRYTLSLARDITERRLMEQAVRESEERYRILVEFSPDLIFIRDQEQVVYANPAAARMVGARSAEDLIGRSILDFALPERREHLKALIAANNAKPSGAVTPPYEGTLMRLDGSHVPIELTAVRFQYRGTPCSQLLMRDITERKRAEDALRRLKDSLEIRVRERTAELEEANTRLQELDRLKTMFIASMSHELRTPLNSAIGFTRILHEEWAGPLNEEQKQNLAMVLKSCKHLLALINDVIDVSRMEAGMITAEPEEFDVWDLVLEAATSCEKAIRKTEVELKVRAIRHTMRTDRTRLLQCLLNLLTNAAKFTEEGSISISAELTAGGEMLELSVADTGIGIREEDLGKLFRPFVRLDSHLTAVVPGTGLGLYLTRKLATELLRGDITVQSAVGAGSVFVLTVPVVLEHPAGSPAVAGDGVSARQGGGPCGWTGAEPPCGNAVNRIGRTHRDKW